MPRITPRRVLLSTDAVGGVWRYVLEMAGGLVTRGVEPIVVVVGPQPSAAQRMEASAIVSLIETGLPLDWMAESEASLANASDCLADLARDQAVDLAHLHAPAFAGWKRWPVPVVSVVHSCLATWWNAVRGTALPTDFRWRAVATERGLRASCRVITPTAAFADAVRAAYAFEGRIDVVHNGRWLPEISRAPRERAVLAVGRLWDDGKNIAALDRAAACLHSPVYAAGPTEGPNGSVCQFDNLRLLGTLGESALRRRYADTAIFASPARYEPFGLGVLEAAQGGMALVLSDLPTFRELWQGAALFVEPDDDTALARAIEHLLDSPDAVDRAGAMARERARSYTVEAMIAGTIAVHEATLSHTATMFT